jgi:hypothetical protein
LIGVSTSGFPNFSDTIRPERKLQPRRDFLIMKLHLRTDLTVLVLIALCLGTAGVSGAVEALGARKARELLQRLGGGNLAKNQVEIISISPGLGGNDAVVEAQIETAFRFTQEKGQWRISDVRFGDRQWESFELIEAGVRNEKIRRTTALMQRITDSIEAYRKEFGAPPSTDKISELLDYLSPRYLTPPQRFDFWGEQFEYRGSAEGYTLRSGGPDQKNGGDDDLIIENGALKTAKN